MKEKNVELNEEMKAVSNLFETANSEQQWMFIISMNSDHRFNLILKEEETLVHLRDDKSDGELTLKLKESIGNFPAIKYLLDSLGINHKFN